MLAPSPEPMAICADNVALGRLRADLRAALQGGPAGAQIEALRGRVAVVEVHLMTGETTSAIGTWDLAERPQERGGGRLAMRDALKLALAIRRVVRDVRRPLLPLAGHAR